MHPRKLKRLQHEGRSYKSLESHALRNDGLSDTKKNRLSHSSHHFSLNYDSRSMIQKEYFLNTQSITSEIILICLNNFPSKSLPEIIKVSKHHPILTFMHMITLCYDNLYSMGKFTIYLVSAYNNDFRDELEIAII